MTSCHRSLWIALLLSSGLACSETPSSDPAEPEASVAQQRLDSDVATRITQKWTKLGGAAVVGDATSAVESTPDGSAQYQRFAQGVIVYSVDFGAVLISQAIFDKWMSLGSQVTGTGENLFGYFGVPIRDYERFTGNDRGTFERGAIIVQGSSARTVYGDIYGRYLALAPQLGLPINEEASSVLDGRYQTFEQGEIHNKPGIGAFGVSGPVLQHWMTLGGPGGSLGFPVSDTASLANGLGLSGRFQNGVVYYSDASGAHEVTGAILTAYENRFGGPTGWLGFPLSGDSIATSGDHFNDFQSGVLVDHLAADAYQGVLPFGSLEFRLSRLEGFGDDCALGICGDQDIYAYLRLNTPAGQIVDVRLPGGGDYGTDQKDLAEHYGLSVARGDFRVDASIEVWDADDTSDNDHLGTVSETYTIDNLWGLLTNPYHRSGDGAATFTVGNDYPFDRSDFRGQMFWSFENFSTSELSYTQFSRTFADVSPDEATWRHPFNKLYYELVYQGIASKGNCFGMSVESVYAQLDRSLYSEPIHDYFPNTQDGREPSLSDPAHAPLMGEINVKQGYQLGVNMVGWTVGMFLTGMTHDPMANFVGALALHELGEYPLISIFDDYLFGSGHSVRPYAFEVLGASCSWSTPTCARIHIADSNHPTGVPSGEPYTSDDFIEIDPSTNSYRYRNYSGNFISGGRMFFQPFRLFSHTQYTPFANPIELLENGMLLIVGSTAKTNQITDGQGRTFFKPGISGPPARWDDIVDDGGQRIPNLSPVVLTDLPESSAMPVQMYAGRGVGATHRYEIVPTPGVPSGTPYEVTFESAKLSSHFAIPGTPTKPELITARDIGMASKAVSLKIADDGVAKQINWTVASAEKQRWASLTGVAMQPAQEITVRLDNGGYDLVIDNNGPATSGDLTVKAGPGATPVSVGVITIPSGNGQVQFQLPVTTLSVSNEVFGNNGWLKAPVTLTMTAKDYSGTGIAAIEHSPDQTSWTTYSGPFVYGLEGQTTLYYRARDNAQNQELPKSRSFNIDTQVPQIALHTDQSTYTRTQAFVVHFSASDPSPGSGLQSVSATLDGVTVTDGQSIDLLWYGLGTHVLTVTATDVAGWTTTSSVQFQLEATLSSLDATIRLLRSQGELDSPSVTNSLLAKVSNAANAVARGDVDVARALLTALLNEIAAQSGKHITLRAAELLTADVSYVLAHLT